MSGRRLRGAALALVLAVVAAGCVRGDLEFLAGDAIGGRDNGTPGSTSAQNYILGYLQSWTEGVNGSSGADAYKQPISGGTNLVGVLPGTDLADEYVMIGAHYDSVGTCRDLRPGDSICNGATDNASGVVAALAVMRKFAYGSDPPRRSIVFAFWDREEDGLVGSQFYTQNPLVPLDQTVAYVNLDILGVNLRPSLRNFSVAVGAETGGLGFRELVSQAIAGGPLGTRQLSIFFGQGRSDHVNFVNARVPSVFFSDATGPCYHSDSDDVAVVDFDKLELQIEILNRLMRSLASTERAAGVHERHAVGDLRGCNRAARRPR